MDCGKGSKPRPLPNKEQFDRNWDAIFKKKTKTEDSDKTDNAKSSKKKTKK